jgi:hypothetical protein
MSWCRGQAYAQHLRDRVLTAIDRGMRAYEAAQVFQVGVSWIFGASARDRREHGATAGQSRAAQAAGVP